MDFETIELLLAGLKTCLLLVILCFVAVAVYRARQD